MRYARKKETMTQYWRKERKKEMKEKFQDISFFGKLCILYKSGSRI